MTCHIILRIVEGADFYFLQQICTHTQNLHIFQLPASSPLDSFDIPSVVTRMHDAMNADGIKGLHRTHIPIPGDAAVHPAGLLVPKADPATPALD